MEFAILISLVFYFIPTFIAFGRGHGSKWAIFVVNFLLGWMFIGWIWSFIWSLTNKGIQNVVVNNVFNNNQQNRLPDPFGDNSRGVGE